MPATPEHVPGRDDARCPNCECGDSKVLRQTAATAYYFRDHKQFNERVIRRKRQCRNCRREFSTAERIPLED